MGGEGSMKTLGAPLLACARLLIVEKSAMMATAFVVLDFCSSAQAQQTKPNILVIFGDDIGQSNISVYTHGLVGYKTPTSTASRGKA